MKLATFIDKERDTILEEWERFARAQTPAAEGMDALALRDHASEILTAIIRGMDSSQTDHQQDEKSKGRGGSGYLEVVGKLHAELRIESGFKLSQMVAEYRALRGSVLRLWLDSDPVGVTRFNEAIDQALTEAVLSFADRTEQFRDQSIGILSHDLRNPLSAITAGAMSLTESDDLDDQTARVAARMLSSANRMSRMIDDLLDFTRTRFGQQIPVTTAPIDLEPLCRQVIAELEPQSLPGGLELTARGDLRGEWDGDRIAQLLSNLVGNAIQHGGTERIRITATDAGADVAIEVHNSGPPIPPHILRSMFEPMVRHANNGGATRSGLGLGLYIACQIVLAHDGSLDATSTEADGTKFSVRLPRRMSEAR